MAASHVGPAARPLPETELDEAVAAVGPAWRALEGARILVTGGTGFFGRWLVETFLRANAHHSLGAHAVLLTRDRGALAARAPHLCAHPALTVVEADVRRLE